MRILAIRGANLASLADDFKVELTAPPLAGTGLFAITGETGAGKSTILDALCLALYGQYPRASVNKRERILDPSGEEVLSSDPKNILRRGAAQGYAEVDFIGADGEHYTAHWGVRRARGSATGRLQANLDRTLIKAGGAVVATGIKPVLEAVEARSGFNFDEFRRAVLLAQGEFDAFLLADESERAALLEKITGTEIYSRISSRVYAETSALGETLKGLEAELAASGALDDDARAALESEAAAHGERLSSVARDLAGVSTILNRLAEIARLRAVITEAGVALAAATANANAAGADRARLAAIAKADSLRRDWERCDESRQALASHERAADEAAVACKEAEAAVKAAAEVLAQRKTAADAAAAEVERYKPVWIKARDFDEAIAVAERERVSAEAACAKAKDKAQRLSGSRKEIKARHEAALARRDEAEARLAAVPGHAILADNAREISKLFDALLGLRSRQAVTERELAQADAKAAELARRLADAEAARARYETERAALKRQLADRRGVLAKLDPDALKARDEALSRLDRELERLIVTAHRRDEARAELQQGQQRRSSAEARRAQAEERQNTARKAHQTHAAVRAEVARFAGLAEATLSEQAAHLRSTLVGGAPCPVCGATEHPSAAADDPAAALARDISRRREELDAALERVQSELTELAGEISAARAESEAAAELIAARTADAEQAAARMTQGLTNAVLAAKAAGLSATGLTQAGPVAVGILEDMRAAVASTQSELRDALTRAAALSDACAALVTGIERLTDHIDDVGLSSKADEAQQHDIARARAGLAQSAAHLGDAIEEALSDLMPYLSIAGAGRPDIDRDAAAASRQLARLAEAYGNWRSERDAAAADATNLATELSRSEAEYAAAHEDYIQKQGAVDARAQAADEAKAHRAALLDGIATDIHRSGIEGRDATAQAALGEALQAAAAAREVLAGKASAQEALAAALDQARKAEAKANRALDAALMRTGLSADEARGLLAIEDGDRQAIAERLARLDRAVEDARATRETRAKDLQSLLTGFTEPDAGSIAQLEAEHRNHLAEIDMIKARAAVIAADLQRDDQARRKRDEKGQKIAKVRADYEIWQAVDSAIGQQDGAKFRRFAQGVTLGQLIRLANEQLQILNGRFALRQSRIAEADLALDVVDREFGDDARSPRSLSGGERFLVSLALALALSGLEGRQSFVDTLFVDEGFGSLDQDTLDVAITALESLQGQGRKVGVITHVQAMIEQIPVQVRVTPRGRGRSIVRTIDGGGG